MIEIYPVGFDSLPLGLEIFPDFSKSHDLDYSSIAVVEIGFANLGLNSLTDSDGVLLTSLLPWKSVPFLFDSCLLKNILVFLFFLFQFIAFIDMR